MNFRDENPKVFLVKARFAPSTPRQGGAKFKSLVGATGLEPATSRPPALRASQLRYAPISYKNPIRLFRHNRSHLNVVSPHFQYESRRPHRA